MRHLTTLLISLATVAATGARTYASPADSLAAPATTSAGAAASPAVEKVYKAANPIHPRLVMKYRNNFLITDLDGWVQPGRDSAYGLYKDDTRYLNQWNVTVNNTPLTALTSSTKEGYSGTFMYSNAPEQNILAERLVAISDDGFCENLGLTNYTQRPISAQLHVRFSSDFADMFEVRGQNRPRRGEMLSPQILPDGIILSYKGLDDITRYTRITVASEQGPPVVTADSLTLNLTLNPRQTAEPVFKVESFTDALKPQSANTIDADDYLDSAELAYEQWRKSSTRVKMTDGSIAQITEQGFRDLFMLRQPVPGGQAIAAGIPWFACAFGRDQLITGMQLLPFNSGEARSVIELLSYYQGKKDDPFTEEHPGRIMHELRLGEMAHLREIPFVPFYGTVDATPLFVVLYCDYLKWTGDTAFAEKYWPNAKLALDYLESTAHGGYLTYGQQGPSALTNQGWKDSGDSVMYADGKLAVPPVALCEPQGYWYRALNDMASVADQLKHPDQATALRAKAAQLRLRFDKDFWMPSKNYVALAIDGTGKQCDVISSNPGHLLSSGILTGDEAAQVADRIFNEEMFSGWGIRTLAETEVAYNPMSYHDGSVWPHDNAYIATGLGKLEDKKQVIKLIDSFANMARVSKHTRLPELFCGFSKDFNPDKGPIPYPVSCTPQAWAAGSMFQMLTSTLGLEPDAWNNKLLIVRPQLPSELQTLTLNGLKVGKGQVDLQFTRGTDGSVSCKASNIQQGLQVEIVQQPVTSKPAGAMDAVAP
jgi:glycogen debranching enzyme